MKMDVNVSGRILSDPDSCIEDALWPTLAANVSGPSQQSGPKLLAIDDVNGKVGATALYHRSPKAQLGLLKYCCNSYDKLSEDRMYCDWNSQIARWPSDVNIS